MVYTLYDKGSLIVGDYQYKMLVRYQTAENQYEIALTRFHLTTNILDTTWGTEISGGLPSEAVGVFRMTIGVDTTKGFDEQSLTTGLWKDSQNNLVFGGLVMLPDVNNHGYFLAKVSTTTGQLVTNWGADNAGITLNQVTTKNLHGIVAELLVQDNDGIITAGTIESGNIKKMVVMKHTPDGSQNTNFKTGYKIYNPLHTSLINGVICKALSFDTYGNYFIAGNSPEGISIVVSLNSVGNINNNFSGDGEHVLPSPGVNESCTIAAMLSAPSKGGLYILANYKNTQTNVETATAWRVHYNDGDVDSTFNQDGKVELIIPGKTDVVLTTIRMDRELSVFIGGFCRDAVGGVDSFFIKMDQDGIYDGTFGIGGVFLDNNSSVQESGGYLYVDYKTNDIKYSIVYRNDANPDSEVVLLLGTLPYSGDANNLPSYDHIDKQLISSEQIAKVLQAMNLNDSTIISFPVSEVNSLFKNSYDSNTDDFTTDAIALTLSDDNGNNNDFIKLVQSGLIPDFWNYFIQHIGSLIPTGQQNIWDKSSGGSNGYTDEKLLTLLKASNGTITITNLNSVLDEYVANDSIFTHRMNVPKSDGFVVGDKIGCSQGMNVTLSITISAATGGTSLDTFVSDTKSYNLIMNLV